MDNQKPILAYNLPYVIKAEWTSYLMVSIVLGWMPFFGIKALLENPTINNLFGALMVSSFWLGFMIWLTAFKIIINENGIFYRTLFSRHNEVKFNEILKVNIRIGKGKEWNRKNAFYRFNIYDNNKFKEDPLTINMKPFSERDLSILANAITICAPQAICEDFIKKLSQGEIKPIIDHGRKQIGKLGIYIFFLMLSIGLIRIILSYIFQK